MRSFVYALTAVAALIVVVTRLRGQAGKDHPVRSATRDLHTLCGVLAILCWIPFLLIKPPNNLLGIFAIALWWLTALLGLLRLLRWLPSRGKHATPSTHETWLKGPGLSLLAHVVLLIATGVFTWYYVTL